MEDVLDVYDRPYDPLHPQVCFDEKSVQLIAETRRPLPAREGQPERFDYEYQRKGTANLFLFFQPLAAWRKVLITDRRTKIDFAECMRYLVDELFPQAESIVLVLDNLNTHTPASLYEAFEPAEAKRILDRLEFNYTPKHGSWLNMVEIEIGVLNEQCLDRYIPDREMLASEIAAWERSRNERKATVWTRPHERCEVSTGAHSMICVSPMLLPEPDVKLSLHPALQFQACNLDRWRLTWLRGLYAL